MTLFWLVCIHVKDRGPVLEGSDALGGASGVLTLKDVDMNEAEHSVCISRGSGTQQVRHITCMR